ncbi:MAG: FG-GAP repeat domain-containing protein [Myxococcota bacterium]
MHRPVFVWHKRARVPSLQPEQVRWPGGSLLSGLVVWSVVWSAGGLIPATVEAAPYFVEQTSRLGAAQPCADSNEGCNSHYALLADLNGDGALDILFANGGGYYQPGDVAPLALYLNDGQGMFTDVSVESLDGFEGRLQQVAVADLDRDGDLDVVAPDAYGLQADALFLNDGALLPHFSEEGAARLGTTSRAGSTRFGDLDNDGDADLVISSWGDNPPRSAGTAKVYLNDGRGYFKELTGAVPQNTAEIGTGPVDLDLLDMDGDFDLDLLLASRTGDSLLFRNDGRGLFADANAQLPTQPGPYVYGPDACDVDADGDLDLWLDNGALDRKEQLLINDGTGRFTDETRTRLRTGSNLTADDNKVQCVDIDQDGDADVVIASLSGNERVLLNDGTGKFSLKRDAFPTLADSTLGLDLGDLNGDGRLDVVTGQGESGSYLNRLYFGLESLPLDVQAPRIRSVERLAGTVSAGVYPVRFAVFEQHTSDVGPPVIRAWVQLSSGEQLEAASMGGDLFRGLVRINAGVSTRFRVCAQDAAGLIGCSAEQAVSGT